MLLYVVVYDIPCDKRRKKISDLLEGYGCRVQYSVFECNLPSEKYRELLFRLRRRVDLSEDHVRFYPLSGHTSKQIEIWGNYEKPPIPSSIIV